MELRLSPRMFDALILNLRTHVAEVASSKEIMIIAVRDGRHAALDLHPSFPGKNETTRAGLARQYQGRQKYSRRSPGSRSEIERRQRKLEQLEESSNHLTMQTTSGSQPQRCRSASQRRAAPRKEMVEANLRLVIPSPRNTPTAACSSWTSSRKATSPDEGSGQVRVPPRLQDQHLRDLVDPPGDHRSIADQAVPSASRCHMIETINS